MHCPWGNGLAGRNNHPHYFFIHWISAIQEAKHLLWGPSWWASNFQALAYDLPWKGLTLSRTLMVYLRENRWSGRKQESLQVPLAICTGAGLPDQRTWNSNIPARVHGERRMLETLAAENIICVIIRPANYDKIRKDTQKGKGNPSLFLNTLVKVFRNSLIVPLSTQGRTLPGRFFFFFFLVNLNICSSFRGK